MEGFSKENFLADRRTQQAVILNIVVIGEAATKLADEYPEFVARYSEVQYSIFANDCSSTISCNITGTSTSPRLAAILTMWHPDYI